jgi:ribosomal protein S18 acetylase RimI-like enzyme
MPLIIIEADLNNPKHCNQVVSLTNAYAIDEMGGGKPLPLTVQEEMIQGLKEMPTTLIFLAYKNNNTVGIATCFWGYSTFYAKKLIYIHDIAVIPEARGLGVGKRLLEAVTKKGIENDCCKISLEVLEHNPAQKLYKREGFSFGDSHMKYMSKLLV